MRILLVEDEEQLRNGIKLNLELEGFEVKALEDGRTVLGLLDDEHFDLLVLDVMMPFIDGFELCRQIRVQNHEVPILFLTARNTSLDKIHGLKLGADDYLTKPFHLEEFILRVKNLLRRSPKMSAEMTSFEFGGNTIYFSSYEAETWRGETISLTEKEGKLLKLLVERKDKAVSRQEILQYVWGYDVFPSTRTIDNFILAFRKYFERDPKSPRYFHSVRGVGYKFKE